jgi:glutathione S-transferase
MTASPWEYHAALLPLCFEDSVVAGDITTTAAKPGRPVLMEYADEAEQRRFLKALLELSWLAPEIRYAVVNSLGRSSRAENVKIERARTATLHLMVDETLARIGANGERPPRGDLYTAAVEEVAERAGIEAEALKKRIQRLTTRGRDTS